MTDRNHPEPAESATAQELPADILEQIERYDFLLSLPMKSRTHHPKARDDEGIVVQDVLDEYVVYDLLRTKVHSLNPTAATVWTWCDGQTSSTELVNRLADHLDLPLEQAEPLLWLALDRLETAKLLNEQVERPPAYANVTRRHVLQLVSAAGLLPVVHSIVAPTPAMAQSLGRSCNIANDCPCVISSIGSRQICCNGGTCTGGLCVSTGTAATTPFNICAGLCGGAGAHVKQICTP